MLLVDEAHYFKNLYCPTKMTRVSGMPNSESQRAFDMFMKVRSVLESGGRGVFATGTPISNSIADLIFRRRRDHSCGFTPLLPEMTPTLPRWGRDWIAFIQ